MNELSHGGRTFPRESASFCGGPRGGKARRSSVSKFEATVEDIVFRNEQNGWTVAAVRIQDSGRTSAVGVMPFLAAGEHVIFDGELVSHRDYGEQIRVDSYETLRPETKSGVEKYLGSGLIKGVGPATAALIVQHFGKEALDVLESEPDRLTEVPGIGPKRARLIAESFAMNNEARNTQILLQGWGITPNLAAKVIKAYGDMTEAIIRKNPYRLADDIDGVGFRTADEIARKMGFPADSPERLASGVRYTLDQAMSGEGHVYLPREELAREAARILAADMEPVENAIGDMVMRDALVQQEIQEQPCVYLPQAYRAECDVARLLRMQAKSIRKSAAADGEIQREIERYEISEGVSLCAEQRQAVRAAAEEGVCVITGGPGTGKTTSINAIIRILGRTGSVELCAPTGRASKRMQEATGREARTLHRLLEYKGDEGGFARNEGDPLDAGAVIVDEMSMVDVFLMRSLLRALRPGTRLILVGDVDQLPSVGAGNVLRDIIDSGVVPVVRLTEIFRQAQESMIVVNAHRINRGEYPIIRTRDTDFFLERRDSAREAVESVMQLVQTRLPRYLNVDSLRGIQVMAPMKRGETGVYALNQRMQKSLNPPEAGRPELRRGETVFRLGDKVMQIKNDYDLLWTRDGEEGEGVFNGDIGFVTRVDKDGLLVRFDDGRCAEYDDSNLNELELAYCISVHKSQGSEFDVVVLPLIAGPEMLMSRNLLYTAVTRAKRMAVIVGRESCLKQMVDNNRILRRMSALGLRLRGEL